MRSIYGLLAAGALTLALIAAACGDSPDSTPVAPKKWLHAHLAAVPVPLEDEDVGGYRGAPMDKESNDIKGAAYLAWEAD